MNPCAVLEMIIINKSFWHNILSVLCIQAKILHSVLLASCGLVSIGWVLENEWYQLVSQVH